MKKLFWGTREFNEGLAALYGRAAFPPEAEKAAAEIISGVRKGGDASLVAYAKKFDRADLAPERFRVTEKELAEAGKALPAADRRAIRTALAQVRRFARLTRPKDWKCSPRPGVVVGEKFTPMERVGVYIPGGTAPLVSTVIHTAGIAKAAGVREVVAVTPPGKLHPATLYAMHCAGVDEVYRLGGVYGVAALAVGTETIRKVEKIAGPGNAYVTAAKKLLYGEVAIDLVAGPSEILVIADETADPAFVAADLLSQAEHGSGLEQAVLVTTSKPLIAAAEKELLRQKALRSRRETIEKVMERGMFLIWVPDLPAACDLAGKYAPEHLELQVASPEKWAKKIAAAGAVFLGPWTPEPVGDFCAGPSHVLPTASSARSFNGLETRSFFRRTSLVKYTKRALMREAEIVERFGMMEGLDAHAQAATIRRKADQG